jgi:hypothetical protein
MLGGQLAQAVGAVVHCLDANLLPKVARVSGAKVPVEGVSGEGASAAGRGSPRRYPVQLLG